MKTPKCYHHVVINSFSQRNMPIKICSRMRTWHRTINLTSHFLKTGVEYRGEGLKGMGGKFFTYREKSISEIIFPLRYRSSSNS